MEFFKILYLTYFSLLTDLNYSLYYTFLTYLLKAVTYEVKHFPLHKIP